MDQRTVDGRVILASPNSISLMLEFDAMPVLWDKAIGVYLDLAQKQPVTGKKVIEQ